MAGEIRIELWRADALSRSGSDPCVNARAVNAFGMTGAELRHPIRETFDVEGVKVEFTLRVLRS